MFLSKFNICTAFMKVNLYGGMIMPSMSSGAAKSDHLSFNGGDSYFLDLGKTRI